MNLKPFQNEKTTIITRIDCFRIHNFNRLCRKIYTGKGAASVVLDFK